MEELLSRIQNKQITDYMREALGCYNSSAYRACIVLCYIALFDDLRQKLFQLRQLNATAKSISEEVEKRADDQQIYEKYMVDQLRANDLITEVEAFRLEQVRVLRNKAAHPSGLHPSAEEARYVYFETIDKFLSQQVLKTTHGVDNLLTRLANSNFFPSSIVSDVAMIVASEAAAIHPQAVPYLIKRLIDGVDSTNTILVANAERFFSGLAVKDDPDTNKLIQDKLLVSKAEDGSKRRLLMTLLSLNPKLLNGLDQTTFLRLRSLMTNELEVERSKPIVNVSHPIHLLQSVVDKLGEDYLETNLPAYWSVIPQVCYSSSIISIAEKAPKMRGLLVSAWTQNAGSSTFEVSNLFATNAPQLDSIFKLLSPIEALKIVLAVCRAARLNAWSAIALRDSKFASTPNLASLARKLGVDQPQEADQLVQQNLGTTYESFASQYLG